MLDSLFPARLIPPLGGFHNGMKLLITLTIVVLLGGVTGPCSSDDKQLLPVSLPSQSPQAPDDEGIPTIPYDEMLRRVAGLSKQTRVANLKDVNLRDDQTEIRIWKGFGLISPRCFIIVIANGKPAASFVTAKVVDNRGVFQNGNLVYINTPLNAPRSGWDNFITYLHGHGIRSSINLVLDKRYMPDPDSEELVLEMKTGSRHTMAYYNDSTATADGKKAFDVCKQIRNEFDINLGCQ
jgi:hypothetical protein